MENCVLSSPALVTSLSLPGDYQVCLLPPHLLPTQSSKAWSLTSQAKNAISATWLLLFTLLLQVVMEAHGVNTVLSLSRAELLGAICPCQKLPMARCPEVVHSNCQLPASSQVYEPVTRLRGAPSLPSDSLPSDTLPSKHCLLTVALTCRVCPSCFVVPAGQPGLEPGA